MDKITGKSGLGALEYGKFRKLRDGEYVVAVSQENEAKVKTLVVSASGNTLLVSGNPDQSIRLRGFQLSREGSNAVSISFREDTNGPLLYTVYLNDDGDNFKRDLSNIWSLNAGKSLYVYASGACNVHVTAEYDGPADSVIEGQYLDDTLSIAEALATNLSKPLADSFTIAVSLAKEEENDIALSDALSITDNALSWTGDAVRTLSDSLPVSDSLGATRFLGLNDSLSVAVSMGYDVIPG
jgi:hypothetical protein